MPARSCSRRLRKPTRCWQTCAVGRILLTWQPSTIRVADGELGWFPRGYLFDATLEDAAFSFTGRGVQAVIETPSGFHILQVIERNAQQPFSPDARYILQEQALQDWLAQRRSQSDIQVIPPNDLGNLSMGEVAYGRF